MGMLGNLIAALALTAPVAGTPVTLEAEPAPTNVTVAWASPTHDKVVITWDETGDVRNRIEAVNADGSPANYPQFAEAGQPNRLEVDKFSVAAGESGDVRIAVTVTGPTSEAISEPGLSPAFDTDMPPAPVLTSVEPLTDGTIKVNWTPGQVRADVNPGDPLDVPAVQPPLFVPVELFTDPRELSEPSTATSFVFGGPASAITAVGVHTVNEWTVNGYLGWRATASYGDVAGTRVTATIPRTSPAGKKLTITGKAIMIRSFCDSGLRCQTYEYDDAGRSLRLEYRTGAGAAWRTVATTKAGADGKYTVSTTFPGIGEYRVVAPVVIGNGDKLAQAPFTTAATRVRPGAL
ncbi:hypothetical protein SAMN05421748_1011252 [Paractinoplanes atraurantiacus]|uniref:Uncharacterized protein n=2 Tax=Paractinoplanes atraurantiacus TaxID=1036182 RepID=A0A285FUE2_9ACTN|nr:hypothetical protein SAMN05421748_1011252 [Actinoplanes atraurantiacus]